MRSSFIPVSVVLSFAACTGDPAAPSMPAATTMQLADAWGSETPFFDLEIVLRGQGFGLVKFRQPNDADRIVYLDTWVRDLTPNTSYLLQRAVDTNLDGECTSTAWLTLGEGLTPAAIVTDDKGTGRAELFRNLSAFPPGATFDIHFQVIDATTAAVVLESGCYQFTVSL